MDEGLLEQAGKSPYDDRLSHRTKNGVMSWTGNIFSFGIYLRDPNIKASMFLELTYTIEMHRG